MSNRIALITAAGVLSAFFAVGASAAAPTEESSHANPCSTISLPVRLSGRRRVA